MLDAVRLVMACLDDREERLTGGDCIGLKQQSMLKRFSNLHALWGTYVFDLWISVLCVRSKAWLASRCKQCSALTRAAAPALLEHAKVTKHDTFCDGSKT